MVWCPQPDSPTEAREATDFLVHNELTVFKLPWVAIQATHKQFIASTTQESHFETVRDLVASIFTLLKHTPVQKLGINLEQHHRFADVERYKEFGHKLAPKDIWRRTLTDPGLVKMVVGQNSRSDGYHGSVQVELAISGRVTPGVYFRVNDHFEWPAVEGASGAETALKILNDDFRKSLEHSIKTIETLLSIA